MRECTRFSEAVACSIAAALLTFAACGGGGGSAPATNAGNSPAAVHTLAYAVADCRDGAHGSPGRAALLLRQGESDAVTIYESSIEGIPNLCSLYGQARAGIGPSVVGGVQRLTVSRDGSFVIFEATNDFSIYASLLGLPVAPLPPEKEGIFVVRADGSGLRRLGPASREPAFRAVIDFTSPTGFRATFRTLYSLSRDGRLVTFPDRGPGPTGEDAVQIVTLDIDSGKRTQVTHLPPATSPDPLGYATCCPFFRPDGRLQFFSRSNPNGLNPEGEGRDFTVNLDGSGLAVERAVAENPVSLPGNLVVPSFQIKPGAAELISTYTLPGQPTVRDLGDNVVREVFARAGDDLLQLTNFHRSDTYAVLLSPDGQRVFFFSSADPFGTNPSENCQMFSIDTLGADLRQLTQFGEGTRSANGCYDSGKPAPPPGCAISSVLGEDTKAHTVFFLSNCDPFGANPYGSQIFAIRDDGTGLRQLTHTRGLLAEADGTVTVESPYLADYGPN